MRWRTADRFRSIEGTLRASTSTKQLLHAIRKGEIALIRHPDLDRTAADGLVEAGVKAVVNAAPTMTGTFPHDGPFRLVRAGIPVFEIEASDFDKLQDGERVTLRGGRLLVGATSGNAVECRPVTDESLDKLRRQAERHFDETFRKFVDNTLEFADREKDGLLRPLDIPRLATAMRGKHVVVVARGAGYKDDLAALRAYMAERRPVVVAVDGGADALLLEGVTPDLIVGDMDSVSDDALRCGAQLLVHAYGDGRAPGLERVERLGLKAERFRAPGTSEDAAMRLAYEEGAALIVTVGTHSHTIDFLEKGRNGMASTLLLRMKIGHKLVDARGAGQLYGKKDRG